jgi:hypothetical protein
MCTEEFAQINFNLVESYFTESWKGITLYLSLWNFALGWARSGMKIQEIQTGMEMDVGRHLDYFYALLILITPVIRYHKKCCRIQYKL